jgi:1-acyl-sn-glycerol-3-phosphate acyltransferase
MGRNREPVASLILYHAFKWSVVSPLFNCYFQGQVHGRENVPTEGAFVVVSNHASYFDPPLLSNCVGRPVAYMAKEELFKIPVFKQAIQLYGAYPVKRHAADRSTIRAALSFLEAGWATGVFLQGTRSPDERITDPKPGAAFLAAKAKVPLLPVSLLGTAGILVSGSSIPRPVPVTVRIGTLIDAPSSTDRQELEVVTQRCATEINALYDLGR